MIVAVCIMVLGLTSQSFGMTAHEQVNPDLIGNANTFEDTPIPTDPTSNKHRIVDVYIKTTTETYYNEKRTRKCVCKIKHYKVYRETIGSGVRVFLYNKYKWNWKGYKKVNGEWKYVTQKSGTTRDITDATNIYSFLLTF